MNEQVQTRGFDRTVKIFLAVGIPVCLALAAAGAVSDHAAVAILMGVGLLAFVAPITQFNKARDTVDVALLATVGLIGGAMTLVGLGMALR